MKAGSVFRQISNNFPSETTGPIVTKSHMLPPGVEGTKICSKSPGHMINMVIMPIYGKKT